MKNKKQNKPLADFSYSDEMINLSKTKKTKFKNKEVLKGDNKKKK